MIKNVPFTDWFIVIFKKNVIFTFYTIQWISAAICIYCKINAR